MRLWYWQNFGGLHVLTAWSWEYPSVRRTWPAVLLACSSSSAWRRAACTCWRTRWTSKAPRSAWDVDCADSGDACPTNTDQNRSKVTYTDTAVRSPSCHTAMGSHSVTYHPVEVTFPALLYLSKAGTRFSDPRSVSWHVEFMCWQIMMICWQC